MKLVRNTNTYNTWVIEFILLYLIMLISTQSLRTWLVFPTSALMGQKTFSNHLTIMCFFFKQMVT